MSDKALFAVVIVCDIIAVAIFSYMAITDEVMRIILAIALGPPCCIFLLFAIYCIKHWNDDVMTDRKKKK